MGVYRETRFRKGQFICRQDWCLAMVRLSCTSRSGNLCGIQFTNGDAVAVCCVVNSRGSVTGVRFLKGGKYYAHRCRRILKKIEVCSDSSNHKYWKKLKHMIEDMAHQTSRRIVEFCAENGVGAIVLPKYSKTFTKYVMAAVGNWSPLHLNYLIRGQLKYKAWQAGILVLESEVSDIGRYCARCGGLVRRQGEACVCENGHQGNRRVNAAWNLGKKTWQSLSKQVPYCVPPDGARREVCLENGKP